ncbi:hypothetical protein [Paraliobacillus salinarum]|uniref:hypothetical protein n=1 Tax=Paraliobacillus salinarum TaxID=1158996 RepID=UPI0015F4B14C|nr:hypothetical protein [Paraliobacillus salinarum]
MRKNILFVVLGSVILYYVMNKETRDKGMTTVKKWLDSMKQKESFPIEEAGVPELDNIENAKMVDEGSQFGVEYYNHLKNRG